MGLGHNIKRIFTWWDGQSFGTQLWTSRNGKKVGEDAEGNVFYRNADDSRRWVIYNGENEASRVSPEWHGWLHRTWDEPPTEVALNHKPWEKPHQENLTGTVAAYAPAGSIRKSAPAERSDYEAWAPE
ncbi:NADH:ubiquinone oxidoreductase subunit NDUFA12 [Yoonia maritima]|uniref:NADH:ubiquinone oxidoreductase subunit NDUFA12 n=1 Tax=Yoonia maritima TaxID=1435347 RepID=UPI000D0E3CD4|nr:NADH:ubiquinone oxidoreductase subunit NDUFA12 [Yoonia maritima]